MDSEMLNYLTHAACNKIDKLIDALPKAATDADFAEANSCIARVQDHLTARLAQTIVPFVPPAAVNTFTIAAHDADGNTFTLAATDAELNKVLGI